MGAVAGNAIGGLLIDVSGTEMARGTEAPELAAGGFGIASAWRP